MKREKPGFIFGKRENAIMAEGIQCFLRGGGGYLSTVHGTGTCHFLGVLFSNHYGIMGIIFTIFDISREYGCPFQRIFHNFRNYGPEIYSICGIMALKSARIYGIMSTNFSGKMARPLHIIG